MRILILIPVLISLTIAGCSSAEVPVQGMGGKNKLTPQAVSLLGKSLYAPVPAKTLQEKYNLARADFEKDPNSAGKIIWYGRRTAYLGNYQEAISIFTMGLKKFPTDARFFRHRGHRFISTRQFDKAIRDLENAVLLIRGQEDEVEPDGLPNTKNIPLSTLHNNIWYHLGLAYYLKNDMQDALRCYRECLQTCKNDDMTTAVIHWLYMTLRRLGRTAQARTSLDMISRGMTIIENQAYFRLSLFYKGEIPESELYGTSLSAIMDDATAYGIGNWYWYNGNKAKARKIFQNLIKKNSWASFGYIAAEADLARDSGNQ